MRAVVYDRYGPPEVLHFAEVPQPIPKKDEVLVKLHAVGVTRADCETRAANRRSGLFISLLSRLVFASADPGSQSSASSSLARSPGSGATLAARGRRPRLWEHAFFRFGAWAEYICLPQDGRIAHMPAGLTFQEAAPITDGGLNALGCLKLAGPREGQRILVYGASGAIGTAGVQLAKYFGADVTAVCKAKHNELVRTLGADRVIDYTQQDFTKNGETYDVIFDAVGKLSFRRCRGSLNPGGFFMPTYGPMNAFWALWTSRIGNKRVMPPIARSSTDDVLLLKELIEVGKYRVVVDRTYPFEDVVEAARYVDTAPKMGNVVLTVISDRG